MTIDGALSILGNPESTAAQEGEAVGFLIKTALGHLGSIAASLDKLSHAPVTGYPNT